MEARGGPQGATDVQRLDLAVAKAFNRSVMAFDQLRGSHHNPTQEEEEEEGPTLFLFGRDLDDALPKYLEQLVSSHVGRLSVVRPLHQLCAKTGEGVVGRPHPYVENCVLIFSGSASSSAAKSMWSSPAASG